MKNRKSLITLLLFSITSIFSINSFAKTDNSYALSGHCEKYSNQKNYIKAIQVVASYAKYSPVELCELSRLADIYVVDTNIYNPETRQDEDHIWVTLHYNAYSCQYFVRNSDFNITKKDCYDTW